MGCWTSYHHEMGSAHAMLKEDTQVIPRSSNSSQRTALDLEHALSCSCWCALVCYTIPFFAGVVFNGPFSSARLLVC